MPEYIANLNRPPNLGLVLPDFDSERQIGLNRAEIPRIDLQISSECQMVCPACRSPIHHPRSLGGVPQPESRSAEEWTALIDKLDAYAGGTYRMMPDGEREQAAPPRVIVTGGEPLLSEALLPVLKKLVLAPHLGRITVSSNCVTDTEATTSRANEMLKILRPGRDEVAIPWEGPDAGTTELIRPGSIKLQARERSSAVGRAAMERGLGVKFRVVPTPDNIAKISQIPDDLQRHGFDLASTSLKVVQYQPPASVYEQTAQWPGADSKVLHRSSIGERQVFDAALDTAERHPELKVTTQLCRYTAGRYSLLIDPSGVAYTITNNRDLQPKEVLFGNIIDDFDNTMQRYQLFQAASFAVLSLAKAILRESSHRIEDYTLALSALLAEGYEKIAPQFIISGFDRHRPARDSERLPAAPVIPVAELDLKPVPGETALTPRKWRDLVQGLSQNGTRDWLFSEGWEEANNTESIMRYIQQQPGARVALVASEPTDRLSALLDSRSIQTLIIPVEVNSKYSRGRLGSVTEQVLGPGQSLAQQLLRQALGQHRNQEVVVRINVRTDNIGLLDRLPQALEGVYAGASQNVTVQLVEQEPITHESRSWEKFSNDALSRIQENLQARVRSVVVAPWALSPARRFAVSASGGISSEEILLSGEKRAYHYGNLTRDGLGVILQQRRNHEVRTRSRRRSIEHLDLPHGVKASLLDTADSLEALIARSGLKSAIVMTLAQDALARYYFGLPSIKRPIGMGT